MTEQLVLLCNVLNSLPNSVIVYDKNGRVIDANQAACMTHGVENLDELTKTVGAKEEVKEVLLKALSGNYCTTEYKVKNKRTGKDVWLKAQCNPVYTDSDVPIGASIFEKDITAQKELITELKSLKVKG